MNQNLNQNGFGGLETMLIIALLLLLAGAGTYVYSKKHGGGGLLFGKSKSTPVSYTGSANSGAPNGIPVGATSGPASVAPPADATNVIKIADAGFQISVPASLKDLTWSVATNGSKTTLAFSTKSLTAAAPTCAADHGAGAFDTITRGSGQYPGADNPGSGGLLQQYSKFYLAYTLPSAPCAHGLTPATQNLLDDQAQDFYSSLSTVIAL
jgi:hypothetical protein